MPQPRMHGNRTKRDAILDSAVELLLENGYERTSMEGVAAHAGVSRTTVYAHFPDKLELFRAVMTQAASEAYAGFDDAVAAAGAATAADRLVTLLTKIATMATAPQLIAYFRVLIAEPERRQELRATYDEVQAQVHVPDIPEIVARLLVEATEEAGYELTDPIDFATMLLRMTISSLQFDMLVSDFRPSRALREAHIDYTVRAFLRGIRPTDTKVARLPEGYSYPGVMSLHT